MNPTSFNFSSIWIREKISFDKKETLMSIFSCSLTTIKNKPNYIHLTLLLHRLNLLTDIRTKDLNTHIDSNIQDNNMDSRRTSSSISNTLMITMVLEIGVIIKIDTTQTNLIHITLLPTNKIHNHSNKITKYRIKYSCKTHLTSNIERNNSNNHIQMIIAIIKIISNNTKTTTEKVISDKMKRRMLTSSKPTKNHKKKIMRRNKMKRITKIKQNDNT